MAAVPLDRLLLETDAPWCEIRPSHAGAPVSEGAVRRVWVPALAYIRAGAPRLPPLPGAREPRADWTRPAALFGVPCRAVHAGGAHVQTKYEAKDRKKWAEGKLVKGRNEPCCIQQASSAAEPRASQLAGCRSRGCSAAARCSPECCAAPAHACVCPRPPHLSTFEGAGGGGWQPRHRRPRGPGGDAARQRRPHVLRAAAGNVAHLGVRC